MTDEQTALSRRAVACKGWRWMPGMLAWRPDCPPVRLAAIEDAGNALQEYRWLPDLSDPATGGCMLSLLGNSRWMVTANPEGFVVGTGRWDVLLAHARVGTLGEACAHALILLPRKRSGVGGRP